MNKSTKIWIGVAIVVAAFIFWGFGSYNEFVSKQETATTALANVQTTYQRRADLLPNLTKVVKAYAKHEKETFEAVTKARAEATQMKIDPTNATPEQLAAYQKAQGQLSVALGKLLAVAENYPELKASENFLGLQDQLEGCENRINEARRGYNVAVQDYNLSIRRMPMGILANLCGFTKMAKFEAAEGAEKAPDLDI